MLLIQCALHPEAKPFIDYFRLKRRHDIHHFACFSSDEVMLIESGVGKLNATAATAFAGALVMAEAPVCMNIGIAGHATRDLDSIISCHRIEDAGSGKRWYPPRVVRNLPAGENLLTLDSPAIAYPDDSAVDMEASGFFSAVSRLTTLELTQSLKVISDNLDHPPVRFSSKQVEAMIGPHLEQSVAVARELLALRQGIISEDNAYDIHRYLHQWHFSQYQQKQLIRQLQRYVAVMGTEPPWDDELLKFKTAQAVITELNRRVDQQPVTF